jgi:hypothetical protein
MLLATATAAAAAVGYVSWWRNKLLLPLVQRSLITGTTPPLPLQHCPAVHPVLNFPLLYAPPTCPKLIPVPPSTTASVVVQRISPSGFLPGTTCAGVGSACSGALLYSHSGRHTRVSADVQTHTTSSGDTVLVRSVPSSTTSALGICADALVTWTSGYTVSTCPCPSLALFVEATVSRLHAVATVKKWSIRHVVDCAVLCYAVVLCCTVLCCAVVRPVYLF